jgi:dUTP pyrophosphatase
MRFEKVNFEQWVKDLSVIGVPRETLLRWYHNIKLPRQGTANSMGVDFFMPYQVKLMPHNKIRIATGIRWVCDKDEDKKYGLLIVPRSSIGIKLGIRLANTIAVIDSDYYKADNDGHILLVLENTTDSIIELPQGKGIAQGITVTYEIAEGAESEDERRGGIGSTDNKN